jgi:hypothetical protein
VRLYPEDQLTFSPPTVIVETSTVGIPCDTGTCCPFLPQVQPRDSFQRFRAVANNVYILDRRRDLTAFNEPAVLHVERKVPGANLHLSVGVGFSNDAVINRRDDLVFCVRSVFHERTGHTRHWRVLVGLATPGSGCTDFVLTRAY